MNGQAPITILLPVYGRSALLAEAWHSLQDQSDPDWQLLIADDGSDGATAAWIAAGPAKDQRTIWIRRSQNLGLFANLNAALETLDEISWVLLLCSDDRLLPDAVATIKKLRNQWPEAPWILSTHLSIGSDGEPLANTSAVDHCQFAATTCTFKSDEFIPLLLRYGSINGNLTGMAFSVQFWREAGVFRSDWRHAADWEWLIRASEKAPVLLNREPIAQVRTHPAQLSNANQTSGDELLEVAAVQRLLLAHPLLKNEPRRYKWASHRLQFQLWNLFKQAAKGNWHRVLTGLQHIHITVGLLPAFIALLTWLPQRFRSFYSQLR